MSGFFNEINSWVASQIPHIAFALVAALLVLYGSDLHQAIRKRVKNTPFALRLIIFIFVCVFGYGLIIVLGAKFITHLLQAVPRGMIIPTVLAIFIILGLLAERENHM